MLINFCVPTYFNILETKFFSKNLVFLSEISIQQMTQFAWQARAKQKEKNVLKMSYG